MAFTERLTEQLAVVGTIDPQTLAILASTDVIDMTYHRRCLFTLMTGGTVDDVLCQIQEGTVAVPNSAVILTRAAADTDGLNSQYIFEVSAEAMDHGYTVLRGDFTPTGATLLAVLVQADVDRYHPASDHNIGTVAAIATAN